MITLPKWSGSAALLVWLLATAAQAQSSPEPEPGGEGAVDDGDVPEPAAAEPPASATYEPPVYTSVPDDAPPPTIEPEPEPMQVADPCAGTARRECMHYDIGAHGYLVGGTQLFGVHAGVGYDWFTLRMRAGPILNDGLSDRFDTSLLGPYVGGTASAFLLRAERFEARAGIGVTAFMLTEVSNELTYFAGVVEVGAAWYFAPPVSVFAEAQLVPIRSDGLDLGYVPALLAFGLEVTP